MRELGHRRRGVEFPPDVATHAAGNVYVSDTVYNRVQVFDPDPTLVQAESLGGLEVRRRTSEAIQPQDG